MATRAEVISEFGLVPLDEQGTQFQSPVNEGVFEVGPDGAVTWFDGEVVRRRLPNQDRFVTIEDRPGRVQQFVRGAMDVGERVFQPSLARARIEAGEDVARVPFFTSAREFLFDPRPAQQVVAETPQPTVAPSPQAPVSAPRPTVAPTPAVTAQQGIINRYQDAMQDLSSGQARAQQVYAGLVQQFRQAAETEYFRGRNIDPSNERARNRYLENNPEAMGELAAVAAGADEQARSQAMRVVATERSEQGLPPLEAVAQEAQSLAPLLQEAIVSEEARGAQEFAGPDRRTQFIADPSRPEETVMPPWWTQATQPTREGETPSPFYGRAQPIDPALSPRERADEIARRAEERADIASAFLQSRRELQPQRIEEERARQAAAMRESMQERARAAGGEVGFPDVGQGQIGVTTPTGQEIVVQPDQPIQRGIFSPQQTQPAMPETVDIQPVQITPANVYDVMSQRGISLEGMPAAQVSELMNFRAGEGGVPSFLQPQQEVPTFEARGEMAPTVPIVPRRTPAPVPTRNNFFTPAQ